MPAITIPTVHALLWSQSQCALHIEPVSDMLSENRQAYADDRRMDYVPIYIGDEGECRTAADAVRVTMRARQARRACMDLGSDTPLACSVTRDPGAICDACQ